MGYDAHFSHRTHLIILQKNVEIDFRSIVMSEKGNQAVKTVSFMMLITLFGKILGLVREQFLAEVEGGAEVELEVRIVSGATHNLL